MAASFTFSPTRKAQPSMEDKEIRSLNNSPNRSVYPQHQRFRATLNLQSLILVIMYHEFPMEGRALGLYLGRWVSLTWWVWYGVTTIGVTWKTRIDWSQQFEWAEDLENSAKWPPRVREAGVDVGPSRWKRNRTVSIYVDTLWFPKCIPNMNELNTTGQL